MALLEVENLVVSFDSDDGEIQAVRGMTFNVERGQTLGIVGESGSGKSVSTQSILGLASGSRITGSARFDGQDLLAMNESQLRKIRGARISMIFQDPLTGLHPLFRVGKQIEEVIRAHRDVSREQARSRAIEMLEMVGIASPAQRARDYPHQFSGGMRQRVMIAMALAMEPEVLIADEPTTALDVTVQAQILDLLKTIQEDRGTAIVLITHDLGVVAGLADNVVVMYAGRPAEVATAQALFREPNHPYTQGLINSAPSRVRRGGRLTPIAGNPPSTLALPSGCSFHPRCPIAEPSCAQDVPQLVTIGQPLHQSACAVNTQTPHRDLTLMDDRQELST